MDLVEGSETTESELHFEGLCCNFGGQRLVT